MIKSKIQEIIFDSAYEAKSHVFECDVPRRPNGLALSKWMKKEIEEIDKEIDKLEEKHDLTSVCSKGCAECCKQCIVVFASECVAIQTYIDNMPSEQRQSLKVKVLELCDYLEKEGINKGAVANSFIGETAQKELQDKYFRLQRKCIFLDEDNSCMIHAIRPSLCWSYREYESASRCKETCFSNTAIKYDDWERRFINRLLEARPTRKELMILPFAIKEQMNW